MNNINKRKYIKNYQNTHCSKFIAMKLTETIAILVLLKSCIAQVATCKDDNNVVVDCYFLTLLASESQIKCEHCG
ncbi:hypothetical protein T02_16101 [Trichinella nativa]|uniref:Uncharacterized protein n=1 Tax=Trichinella nativa TaxID=6335 RepID=A0A0V1KN19_9BILA|nr:hypothetical protein T02_16101 [Trichinella nativa]